MQFASFFRFARAFAAAGALLVSSLLADTGLHRVTPQGINLPINPGSTTEYVTDREAFPGLEFDGPVNITTAPGETDRLFVVERAGRIILIPNLESPSRQVFLDISERVNSDYTNLENGAEGLNSVAFHPNYSQNGYLYVVYTWPSPSGNMNRLSRFTRADSDSADPNSELVMIEQPDTGYGHNFNDVKFGPDGYLYVALGDEGDGKGPGDEYGNSQRIDKDFFSAILRLDVDLKRQNFTPNPHPAFRVGYKIPADNPYVGATEFNGQPVDPTKVRTEFYAVGFRNPWRLHFDAVTGQLYAGDVGRHGWEEINLVTRGGNYGWAFREGSTMSSALGAPPPGVTLVPPLAEYPHGYGAFEGMCVIGGVVYRGDRFADLQGAYIFGDYATGNLWALRHNGNDQTEWRKIGGMYEISGIGVDPRNGDILLCKDKLNGAADGIYRLEQKAGTGGGEFPATLAETGLFADLQNLVPVPGIVPYNINVPFWSDGAIKSRWFGLLDPASVIGFNREGNWQLHSGAIWVKHFEMELEKGNPASRTRLETRVLIKNQSNNGLYGLTYQWDEANQTATLVPSEGSAELLEIREGDEVRQLVWRYPSRAECISCHTPSGGYALGFNGPQLNREFVYPKGRTNQVIALRDAGYLDGPHENVHTMRRLAGLQESSWSREYRARSYLAANCAYCHNPEGVERARWDGRISTPLSQTAIVDGPLLSQLGDPENRVVKPGDPERSLLLQRMIASDWTHMPPLGSTSVDTEAVQLLDAWIRDDLRDYKSFDAWIAGFSVEGRGAQDDPDADGAVNWLEYLLATDPSVPGDVPGLEIRREGGEALVSFEQKANRGAELLRVSPLGAPGVEWQPLDLPTNRPFIPATNQTRTVGFPLNSDDDSYFKLRVYEP